MNRITLIFAVFIALVCSSCSEEAPYSIADVKIGIKVKQVSAGIINVEFVPSKNAYYYFGIAALDSGQNAPYTNEELFMDKILNHSYRDYLIWRTEQIDQGYQYVASFSDHVLSYGKVDYFFYNLYYNRRYFIYAFVVDPLKTEYVKGIYSTIVTTASSPNYSATFDMVVDGNWDFVYPLDNNGEVSSNIPYVVSFAGKEYLLDYFDGDTSSHFNKPAWYFFFHDYMNIMAIDSIYMTNLDICYFGTSCRHHDISQPKTITFQENETYYASICGTDGMFIGAQPKQTVYKFTWKGENTYVELHQDSDNIGYSW